MSIKCGKLWKIRKTSFNFHASRNVVRTVEADQETDRRMDRETGRQADRETD